MLNERPEGKDKFGYVLIGLLVAFVIILVTSAVIWNSNHPEKVQENLAFRCLVWVSGSGVVVLVG